MTNNGELVFNRNNTYTFAGVISGTGSIRQLGSGTTVLTADNSYTGGTTITLGTLQLGEGAGGSTAGSIVGDVINRSALDLQPQQHPYLCRGDQRRGSRSGATAPRC